MLFVLTALAPVFALIFIGWGARRSGALGPHATGELNQFVVYIALPALLFDIVSKASWHDIWQPDFIAAFGCGMGLIFVLVLTIQFYSTRNLADSTIQSLNAAYANTGFIGFPLALSVFGRAALAPTLIATILTVCVLFAVAVILVELSVRAGAHPVRVAADTTLALTRNPLLLSPLLGGVILALGITVPQPVDGVIKLVSAAASPCALVAIGLFLAEKREATPLIGPVGPLMILKLVGQPVATWFFATWVFSVSQPLANIAVLLAALPTGTGPFMVAAFYGRDTRIVAKVVMVSTIASVATIAILVSWSIGHTSVPGKSTKFRYATYQD